MKCSLYLIGLCAVLSYGASATEETDTTNTNTDNTEILTTEEDSSAPTIILDFSKFFSSDGTLSNESVDGIRLTSTSGDVTLAECSQTAPGLQAIYIKNGSLTFDFTEARNRLDLGKPGLTTNAPFSEENPAQAFSLLLSFDLKYLQGDPTVLFTATFDNSKVAAFQGFIGARFADGAIQLGFWNTAKCTTIFGEAAPSIPIQATEGVLTIALSQSDDNTLSLNAYVNGEHSIADGLKTSGSYFSVYLSTISIGGKNTTASTNMTNSYEESTTTKLVGMEVVSGRKLTIDDFKDYYNAMQTAPEASSTLLGLIGSCLFGLRRKRKSSAV